jgi:hypothetical protein
MKCWNSALNAQGSRVIIIVVQVVAAKTYVEAVEALRKEGVKLSLPPKLVEKLVWSQLFCFAKFHFQLRISCLIMTKLAIPAP